MFTRIDLNQNCFLLTDFSLFPFFRHIHDKESQHEVYLVIKEKTTTTATIDVVRQVGEIEKE